MPEESIQYKNISYSISKDHQALLAEPLRLLSQNHSTLIELWSKHYLETFGRGAHFSSKRVWTIFESLSESFIQHLSNQNFDAFLSSLSESGKMFSDLTVPFEEVVLCIHLFEDACIQLIQDSEQKTISPAVKEAFADMARVGTTVFAISYYRSTKASWKGLVDNFKEENEAVKKELQHLEKDLYQETQHRLSSMEHIVTSMNRHLRRNALRFKQIQKLSQSLEGIHSDREMVQIAYKAIAGQLPKHKDIETILALYQSDKSLFEIFKPIDADKGPPPKNLGLYFASEMNIHDLPHSVKESMLLGRGKAIYSQNNDNTAQLICPVTHLKSIKEYAYIPWVKRGELLGFLWMGSALSSALTLKNIKYLERLCRPITLHLFSLHFYQKHLNQQKLVAIRNEYTRELLPPKNLTDNLELQLDHFLKDAIQNTHVERASILLYHPKKQYLSLYAAKGVSVYPFSGIRLKLGEGIAGSSLQSGKVICLTKLTQTYKQMKGLKSLACFPLIFENELLGVLNLSTMTYHKRFNPIDVESMSPLVAHLSRTLALYPKSQLA